MSLQQICSGLLGESLAPQGGPHSQLCKSKTESTDAFDADWYKAGIICLGNAGTSPRADSMAVHAQSLFVFSISLAMYGVCGLLELRSHELYCLFWVGSWGYS